MSECVSIPPSRARQTMSLGLLAFRSFGTEADACYCSEAQSPGLTDRFHATIDLEPWNATLKPSSSSNLARGATAAAGGDLRPSFPSAYSNNDSGEYQSQDSALSPRLNLGGASRTEAKSHHRQTSIVHGIQHSRNGSFGSSATSPISPQLIAAAGADRSDASSMADSAYPSGMSTMTGGTSFSTNSTLVAPSGASESGSSSGQRRMERMRSTNSSRDYRHHHSNSRQNKEDLKTVGEFALQVLFNSVRDSVHSQKPQLS
jgi:hypothetical protein